MENQQNKGPIKKIVIPPRVQDHLIPNIPLDLLNPFYICNSQNEYLKSLYQIQQPVNDGLNNYKNLMDNREDYGELPDRKSSISSFEDEDIKEETHNLKKESLKIIREENALRISEKRLKKICEEGLIKDKELEFALTKQKEQQDEGLFQKKNIMGCNCKKSKCQKSYCECYSNKQRCSEHCKCLACENMDPENKIKKKISQYGCNCKKTKCLKKYCECFNQGLVCGSNCKCNSCENN